MECVFIVFSSVLTCPLQIIVCIFVGKTLVVGFGIHGGNPFAVECFNMGEHCKEGSSHPSLDSCYNLSRLGKHEVCPTLS